MMVKGGGGGGAAITRSCDLNNNNDNNNNKKNSNCNNNNNRIVRLLKTFQIMTFPLPKVTALGPVLLLIYIILVEFGIYT